MSDTAGDYGCTDRAAALSWRGCELAFSSPVMDGRRSPRTFTPACAAFTHTWKEGTCVLGAYRTAPWPRRSERGRGASTTPTTPSPSPKYTSLSFCSCSFSHRGWIRRGGEWSLLVCGGGEVIDAHDRVETWESEKLRIQFAQMYANISYKFWILPLCRRFFLNALSNFQWSLHPRSTPEITLK